MKKTKGFSTGAIVAIIIAAAILIIGTILIINHQNNAVDFDQYASTVIVEPSQDNGQIGDHVRGNADAPVVIQEYANFQCSHCAALNPYIEQAVAESNGQLAMVFRNLTWAAFQNSRSAAAAAEAAGLQGYWESYAKLLFENQAEWSYANGSERTELYKKYFDEASGGQGDLSQFEADLASDVVTKKIDFDNGLGKVNEVEGTPAFYIDGQLINLTDGGDLTFNGQTFHYDSITANEDIVKLIQDITNAKLNS